jgi:predicted DNA-binding transcriptional regulator YafY
MRILTARRSETTPHLAVELGVSVRTVLRDVVALTVDHPLETQQGNGGCVQVADWYHPHRNILSEEQQQVLSQMIASCNDHQAKVLREMLVEYGSAKYRQLSERDAG